jgi:hypothetical protein
VFVHLLWHDDPSMIKRAIEHVAVHRVADEAVVERLGELARIRNPLVAWEAITTLGMIGSDTELAIKTLEKLSYGPHKGRVERAKAALRSIPSCPKMEPMRFVRRSGTATRSSRVASRTRRPRFAQLFRDAVGAWRSCAVFGRQAARW